MHYRIKVVRENLESSFPEKSPQDLKQIEKEFYHSLCDNIVETIKLLHVSDKTLKKRVKVTNGEIVDNLQSQGKPIVLFLAHYGNWEWMTAMTYYYTPKVFSAHIYKALHDSAADKVMKKARSRMPSHGIELERAVREILRLRATHGTIMVGFISDHRFNNVQRDFSTEFLNHDTPYYIGGEMIGKKIGAEFLYLDVEKTSRGHYRLTFVPIVPKDGDTSPNPITRNYMEMLEHTIRRQPPYWLWSHRRWLKKKPQSTDATEQ